MIASATNVAMSTGLYPWAPTAVLHLHLRRRNKPSNMTARGTAQEWAASMASVVSRPMGFLGPRLRAGQGARPIIVVHGYAMNRACFSTMARRLGEAGLGPIYGFEYWTLGKVSSASRRLHEFIESVCERHGCEEVDLIGHSMGGLVSRYYLSFGPGRHRRRVAHLITVGTPHGGSVFSSFGPGRANVELNPRAPFFQRLAAAPLPKHTEVTVIWSRADALVGTEKQALWPGTEEIVYEDLGHVSLLYSRRVTREIIERLKRPRRTESPSSSAQSSHR